MSRLATSLWVCGLFAASCMAQTTSGKDLTHPQLPELETDRPDFTDSTALVGRGVVQLELGATLDHEGGARHFSQPEALLRLGINSRLEFRLGTDGFVAERTDGASWRYDRADIEVALKLKLWDQRGALPAMAILPILSLPAGSRDFSSGTYDPSVKLLLKSKMGAGFSLGGNIVLAALATNSGRDLQKAYTASLGHSLGGGFDGFWEVYTVRPWEVARNAWIADTGITHGVGENAQWDFRLGRRITAAGPDWVIGAGFAFRYHLKRFL